jgi:hypothetical protein
MFTASSRSIRRPDSRPGEAWRSATMVLAAAALIVGARTSLNAAELLLATCLLPATMLLAWRRAPTARVAVRAITANRLPTRAPR